MTILITVAFFSILFFFGWQTARAVLRENRIEHLMALSGTFGIGLYVFFINIIGFFIPIQATFYLVLLGFFGVASAVHFYRVRFGERAPLVWVTDARERKILLLTTLFLTLSVGFISFNHSMDLASVREPVAVTIAEGSFPPREIWNPSNLLQYHYAPELLSAAMYKVTGVPLYVAYDFQKAIFSGSLFLIAFILVYSFFPGFFVAFAASLLLLYSGSLVFLRALEGVPSLFTTFILGKDNPAPFKFITDAMGADFGLPGIQYVLHLHWGAMAFALMLGVIYIYFHLLSHPSRRTNWLAFVVAGLELAVLALVAESYFVIVAALLGIFPLALFIFKRDKEMLKRSFVAALFIVLIAMPAAIFQGGALKSAVYKQLPFLSTEAAYGGIAYAGQEQGTALMQLGTPLTLYDGRPLYDHVLLERWALLFVVLIPALLFVGKRQFGFGLFLALITAAFFSIPFLFHSTLSYVNGNLDRFFYPVNLFGGLTIGIFLAILYMRTQRPLLKKGLVLLTGMLMAQGLWTHSVWLALGNPPGTWNPNAKFFAQAGSLEADVYRWVKNNTSADDLFFFSRQDHMECGESKVHNCFFVLNTGRMAPTFTLDEGLPISRELQGKSALFNEANRGCDPNILHELGFRYVYVDERWPESMEAQCIKKNDLELVFAVSQENKFIRIYKIKWRPEV